MTPSRLSRISQLFLFVGLATTTQAFSVSKHTDNPRVSTLLSAKSSSDGNPALLSRRSVFQSSLASIFAAAATTVVAQPLSSLPALAAERVPLEQSLYTILRVREATQQESRLIKSGKFKDVQRANVKLAVKFMIENYNLNDAILSASNYLDGNDKRMSAVNAGQSAVQDLFTILEYFDSADVQNLKVGSASLSSDKESVVLKGLDATRRSIDDFLAYFPKDTVETAKAKVKDENDLNYKEFDRGLGDIINQNPTV